MLGFFKRLHRKRAGNGWKSLQKLLEGVTALKILEEGLNRHSSPSEYGQAMHRFQIHRNRFRHFLIVPQRGRLLDAAEAAGFDVLVTVDQNIPDQQNLGGRKLSILVLCGPTNRLRDLAPLAPAAVAALSTIEPGHVVRIS